MQSIVAPVTQGLAAAGTLPSRTGRLTARSAAWTRCRRRPVTRSASKPAAVQRLFRHGRSSFGKAGFAAEEHPAGRFPAAASRRPRSAILRGLVDPVEASAHQEETFRIDRAERE